MNVNEREIELFENDFHEITQIIDTLEKTIRDAVECDIEFTALGSSILRIKGKKDIDVGVIVPKEKFEQVTDRLSKLYGVPEKKDGDDWVKFESEERGFDLDIFLATSENKRMQNDLVFVTKLKKDKTLRDAYEEVKVRNADNRDNYRKEKKKFYDGIVGGSL